MGQQVGNEGQAMSNDKRMHTGSMSGLAGQLCTLSIIL